MTTKTIHLGFEVDTGVAVEIPLKHMAVTGMTQEAGKTTALEALIARSGLRAVTFITKRGEGSFEQGRRIPPFFRERADWQFVASLIDATMGEKNKLLRSWLMKVCRNTSTLAEVQENVKTARASARGFNESIYTEIEGYLEIVVPQLAELPPARQVVIYPGLNVMDLSPYRAELQGLVIRSVIEHVYEHENDVITVIPEAWEFLPEGRGSPVKLSAETLIRKGAALRNYIWVDAQDLGGLWKTIVRAAAVNLVGVQREANEVKRTLANLPASTPRLKPADVASLELGQFYACFGRHAIKTYVQPSWLTDALARRVAMGETIAVGRADHAKPKETTVTKDEASRLSRENEQLKSDNADLRRRLEALEKASHDVSRRNQPSDRAADSKRGAGAGDRHGADDTRERDAGDRRGDTRDRTAAPQPFAPGDIPTDHDTEALYQAFKTRLIAEAPALIRLLTTKPEIEVTVARKTLTMDEFTLKGRMARLLKAGFFNEPKTPSPIRAELKRTGPDANTTNIGRACDDFTRDGFLTDEGGAGYRAVPGMVVNVIEQ